MWLVFSLLLHHWMSTLFNTGLMPSVFSVYLFSLLRQSILHSWFQLSSVLSYPLITSTVASLLGCHKALHTQMCKIGFMFSSPPVIPLPSFPQAQSSSGIANPHEWIGWCVVLSRRVGLILRIHPWPFLLPTPVTASAPAPQGVLHTTARSLKIQAR